MVAVAGGGGGAGADGCGGCAGANPGGGSGGAAGAVDVLAQAGTELYKDYGAIGFVQMGGGMGAGPNGPGGGGVANDQSTYSGCANNGFPGVANQGGGGFGNNTCNVFTTGVGSWHVGGSTKNGNGLGGSGGAGYYGGGGGAGKYTYSGGGGGGGSSWVAGTVTLLVSESGSDALPGGQSAPHYDATAGIGGQNDPPGDGQRGLVVLSL